MKTKLTCLICLCLFPTVIFAQWQKIDDFEYDSSDGLWDTWFLAGARSDLIIAEIIDDPVDPENRVLWFDCNIYQTNLQALEALVPKEPVPVPDGSEVTLYWRWFWTGVEAAAAMGFTVEPNGWIEPGGEGNDTDRPRSPDPLNWPEFRTVVHTNVDDFGPRNNNIYIFDNTWYQIGQPDADSLFEVPIGGWVEYWMHVNNMPGASGLDEYSIYVRPAGGEQVRLKVASTSNPELLFDTALFRGQIAGEIPRFRYVSYPGPPSNRFLGDKLYLDDIYVDYSGLNTSRPEGVSSPDIIAEFWNGLPVVAIGEAKWVESPWLKWLGVDGDPWIWSDALSTWMYMPEYNPSGAWIYIQAPSGEPPAGTGELWNGLTVVQSGGLPWVETPLFKWVMVENDPWLWNSSFSTWMYLPEYDAAGVWVYVL